MADEDFDPELSRSIADMRSNADRRTLVIEYTNYKGVRSVRQIIPMSIRWGATEYHPEEQWLLEAFDRDKGAERTFAVRDIHSWRELGKPGESTEAVTDKMVSAAVSSAIGFGLLSGYWKCTEKEREGWALVFRNVIEAALKAQGRE